MVFLQKLLSLYCDSCVTDCHTLHMIPLSLQIPPTIRGYWIIWVLFTFGSSLCHWVRRMELLKMPSFVEYFAAKTQENLSAYQGLNFLFFVAEVWDGMIYPVLWNQHPSLFWTTNPSNLLIANLWITVGLTFYLLNHMYLTKAFTVLSISWLYMFISMMLSISDILHDIDIVQVSSDRIITDSRRVSKALMQDWKLILLSIPNEYNFF